MTIPPTVNNYGPKAYLSSLFVLFCNFNCMVSNIKQINTIMMEIHLFKLNCISGHVISARTGSGASGAEGQSNSVDGTHMQISGRHYNTDLDRYIQGRPQYVLCLGVCPPSTLCGSFVFTYPIQSFGLYVAKELLSPVSGHPGGDILRLLWYDRSHFNCVVRRLLGASRQSVVRGHLLQQGSHGGTS